MNLRYGKLVRRHITGADLVRMALEDDYRESPIETLAEITGRMLDCMPDRQALDAALPCTVWELDRRSDKDLDDA